MRIIIAGRAGYPPLRQRAQLLAALGVDVHVAGLDRASPMSRVEVHRLPHIPRGPSMLRYLSALPSFMALVRTLKPDVVDGHGATSYGSFPFVPGAHARIVTLYGTDLSLHARTSPLARVLARRCLMRCDLANASSEAARGDIEDIVGSDLGPRFMSRSWGIDLGNVVVASTEERSDIRASLGCSDASVVLVHNRRVNSFSRLDIIIDAFARWGRKDAQLLLLYPEPTQTEQGYIDHLRAQVERLGVEDSVRFLGQRPYAEMIRVISSADAYVCGVRNDLLASSVLEAMALGTYVILPRLPAYTELEAHGAELELLDVLDVSSLIAAFAQAGRIGRATRARRYAVNRAIVERQYDSAAFGTWLLDVLQTVRSTMSSRGGRRSAAARPRPSR